MVTANLSYLAPNQCGLDASHQSWGGAEPQSASRLLLFCHADVQGQRLQLFASTQQSSDGAERTTLGTTWPTATWRLTAQLFQEPAQDRQGYGLRLDRLYPASATLVFIEAEHTTTGQPGFTKLGLQQAYPLTPALSLSGLLTYQRDASAYSPLLENGTPRQLTLAQANLQHTLGTFGGWKVASLAQLTHRSSNIKLFEFNEFTVNIAFKKLF